MDKIFITVVGTCYNHGSKWLEKGDKVTLVKEPDNKVDPEAIKVVVSPVGKIGYVANSVGTVVGDCYSAGRIYDKINDSVEAKIKYILDNGSVICEVELIDTPTK